METKEQIRQNLLILYSSRIKWERKQKENEGKTEVEDFVLFYERKRNDIKSK